MIVWTEKAGLYDYLWRHGFYCPVTDGVRQFNRLDGQPLSDSDQTALQWLIDNFQPAPPVPPLLPRAAVGEAFGRVLGVPGVRAWGQALMSTDPVIAGFVWILNNRAEFNLSDPLVVEALAYLPSVANIQPSEIDAIMAQLINWANQ